jgi:hypothetical protein
VLLGTTRVEYCVWCVVVSALRVACCVLRVAVFCALLALHVACCGVACCVLRVAVSYGDAIDIDVTYCLLDAKMVPRAQKRKDLGYTKER